MGNFFGNSKEAYVLQFLPDENTEFCYDYTRDDIENNIIDNLKSGTVLLDTFVPKLSLLVNFLIDRYKHDTSNRVDRLIDQKINVQKIKTELKNFVDFIQGIESNLKTFRLLNNSFEKISTFTYIVCSLRQNEDKFMSQNMLYVQLNCFLAYTAIYLQVLYQQAFNYESTFGARSENEILYQNEFYQKATMLTKFFEYHCNKLIFKKFASIENRVIFGSKEIFYKGQRIGDNQRYFITLIVQIVNRYYPKLCSLVDSFNSILEKFGLRDKVVLKEKKYYEIVDGFTYLEMIQKLKDTRYEKAETFFEKYSYHRRKTTLDFSRTKELELTKLIHCTYESFFISLIELVCYVEDLEKNTDYDFL